MLQNIRLVKLINFGEAKVCGKLLQNGLTEAERHHPTLSNVGWRPMGTRCEELVEYLKGLIRDWGTHLDFRLYNEALVHHFGGKEQCLHRLTFWLTETL